MHYEAPLKRTCFIPALKYTFIVKYKQEGPKESFMKQLFVIIGISMITHSAFAEDQEVINMRAYAKGYRELSKRIDQNKGNISKEEGVRLRKELFPIVKPVANTPARPSSTSQSQAVQAPAASEPSTQERVQSTGEVTGSAGAGQVSFGKTPKEKKIPKTAVY